MKLDVRPAAPSRWKDLEALFGERGACGGCWCMWWKLSRPEFEARRGAGTKRALKGRVAAGTAPGLLAYDGDKAVGWCSVEPREAFARLGKSRVLAPVDDSKVWSAPCFFVDRKYRRKGVTVALLKAAAAFAKKNGATILEGYPLDPRKGSVADAFAWTGFASSFRRAGFKEVLRRSPGRPIMRRRLG